jgi:hypothetical protein
MCGRGAEAQNSKKSKNNRKGGGVDCHFFSFFWLRHFDIFGKCKKKKKKLEKIGEKKNTSYVEEDMLLLESRLNKSFILLSLSLSYFISNSFPEFLRRR